MKLKMKSKIIAFAMTLTMVFTMMPMMASPVYAKGDSPLVVKYGDIGNFTMHAPITTVRLDAAKFTKSNATLASKNDYYQWGSGDSTQNSDSIWTPEITVLKTEITGSIIYLPSFSLTLKDAAIMRDETRKDLRITFDDVRVFTKVGLEEYEDRFQIVSLPSNGRDSGIDISPLSYEKQHFGLQAKVSCQVVGAGEDDTLLLVAAEINSPRSGANTFERIRRAADNYNFSESMQIRSGVDSESDIYLMGEPGIYTNPEDITNVNGYNVRFVGNGDKDFKLAAAVSATGASADVWSSAGINTFPLDMFFMSLNKASANHTSSSGDGGKIELWTDGLTHDKASEANSFRKLPGGTLVTPYTYAVPHGKKVTYRMTPEKCYEIDKLYVNGSEVDIAGDLHLIAVRNASGEPEYYEYHFGDDTINENQEISVTWKVKHDIAKVERVEPSCTKVGSEAYWKCKNCELMFSDADEKNEIYAPVEIKATGHKYGAWKNLDANQHQRVCEHDKTHIEKANHSWDAGKVTTAATTAAAGVKTYTCTVCKATKTEAIPKLTPAPTPTPTPAPTPATTKVSGKLLPKMTTKGKTGLTISWNKIQGAAGYDIFFARCNHDSKKIVTKKVKTIKGNKTFKWTKSGLKKSTAYKAYVRAYVDKNGKKTYVRSSPLMHAYTGNGTENYTNARSVSVNKTKVTLKKGKTSKIKAKVNKKKKLMPKSHAPTLRYMTSNKKVATVNSSGKITAKGKGTCYIYVYAHNGVSKSIKVTVP